MKRPACHFNSNFGGGSIILEISYVTFTKVFKSKLAKLHYGNLSVFHSQCTDIILKGAQTRTRRTRNGLQNILWNFAFFKGFIYVICQRNAWFLKVIPITRIFEDNIIRKK